VELSKRDGSTHVVRTARRWRNPPTALRNLAGSDVANDRDSAAGGTRGAATSTVRHRGAGTQARGRSANGGVGQYGGRKEEAEAHVRVEEAWLGRWEFLPTVELARWPEAVDRTPASSMLPERARTDMTCTSALDDNVARSARQVHPTLIAAHAHSDPGDSNTVVTYERTGKPELPRGNRRVVQQLKAAGFVRRHQQQGDGDGAGAERQGRNTDVTSSSTPPWTRSTSQDLFQLHCRPLQCPESPRCSSDTDRWHS
jgi:hypothetical protein